MPTETAPPPADPAAPPNSADPAAPPNSADVAAPPSASGPPIIAVVGPTATGKSELALRLAERLEGEIVNADAMQLYRGMDIGTAKVTPDERRGIPHHQLDVLDVTQEASVAAYQAAARSDLTAITTRGRVPILVGGSGLYVRAALDRLEIPPTDPSVRARLESEASARGAPAMYAALLAADPAAATAIEPNNVRRIVRALEVIELTGRPFSATLPRREFVRPAMMVGLRCDRAILDQRIEDRVAHMWTSGLLDEVAGLAADGLRLGRTASTAIGYAQALRQLDGHLTPAQAREETTGATRRLVRRQESWFRSDPRIIWCDVTDTEAGLAEAMDLIQRNLDSAGQWVP